MQGLLCTIVRAFERLAGGIATLASHRDEVLALRRRLKEEQRDKARVIEEKASVQRECAKASKIAEEAAETADAAREKFVETKKEVVDLQKALEEGKERHKREMSQKASEVARLQKTLLEHKAKVPYYMRHIQLGQNALIAENAGSETEGQDRTAEAPATGAGRGSLGRARSPNPQLELSAGNAHSSAFGCRRQHGRQVVLPQERQQVWGRGFAVADLQGQLHAAQRQVVPVLHTSPLIPGQCRSLRQTCAALVADGRDICRSRMQGSM